MSAAERPLPRAEACAPLLLDALAPSAQATAELARLWGLPHSDQHWPIDLLVQGRRRLALSDAAPERARLRLIDNTLARAWPLAVDRWMAELAPAHAQRASGSGPTAPAVQAVQSLAWLSRRIPSPEIHGGLFAALLRAGEHVAAAPAATRESLRAAWADELLPSWMQTLDRASRAQMQHVLEASHLFTPLDKFDGWVWAWRFGIDRAVDFAGALIDAASDATPLPMGSREDRSYLRELVEATVMDASGVAYRAMVESLLVKLQRSPVTLAWGVWLSDVFVSIPDTLALMQAHDEPGWISDVDIATTFSPAIADADEELDPADVVEDFEFGPAGIAHAAGLVA